MRVKTPPVPTPDPTMMPSDFLDKDMALYAIVAGLIILNPPSLSPKLFAAGGACYAAVQLAAALGYEADGVVVIAALDEFTGGIGYKFDLEKKEKEIVSRL